MGWWPIDPATGQPVENASSALSRPPDFVLLNAVPGVDDDAAACYLGDGPWDMASTLPAEIREAGGTQLTAEQIRDLLLREIVPSTDRETIGKLQQVITAFWKDIDWCYEDDWERPSQPAERQWITEFVVERMTRRDG